MTEDKEAASNSIDVAAINAVFPFVDVCPDIDAIFPNVDDAPDGNDADTSTSGYSEFRILFQCNLSCFDTYLVMFMHLSNYILAETL
jgi:hypothetical protein